MTKSSRPERALYVFVYLFPVLCKQKRVKIEGFVEKVSTRR